MHYDLQILKRMEDFWSHSLRPLSIWKKFKVRFEGIALTWATRQVVLWSDHKTAGYNKRLVAARTTNGIPTNYREESSMAIATTNPTTGEVVKSFEPLTSAQIEQKLQLAASAFRSHRRTSFGDRAKKMIRAAEILEKEKDECAHLMTLEMGKPLKAAVAEALKCATGCRYYAENAEKFLADEIVETGAKRSFIRYLPIGPILAIMPWNFPFWQVFRFVAPALMAGNVGLLKHASNVPQCALKIEDILRRASFAEGVFQTLLIGSAPVDGILNDPRPAPSRSGAS